MVDRVPLRWLSATTSDVQPGRIGDAAAGRYLIDGQSTLSYPAQTTAIPETGYTGKDSENMLLQPIKAINAPELPPKRSEFATSPRPL
jgi:hypothetical protein